jgi:hypothetical protein
VGERKMMQLEAEVNATVQEAKNETETNEAFTKHVLGPTPPDLRWNSSTKWRTTHG